MMRVVVAVVVVVVVGGLEFLMWLTDRRRPRPNPYWISEVAPRVTCGPTAFTVDRIDDEHVRLTSHQWVTDSRGPRDDGLRLMLCIGAERDFPDCQASLDAVLAIMHDMARSAAAHEVDEHFRFDGELVFDPHKVDA